MPGTNKILNSNLKDKYLIHFFHNKTLHRARESQHASEFPYDTVFPNFPRSFASAFLSGCPHGHPGSAPAQGGRRARGLSVGAVTPLSGPRSGCQLIKQSWSKTTLPFSAQLHELASKRCFVFERRGTSVKNHSLLFSSCTRCDFQVGQGHCGEPSGTVLPVGVGGRLRVD